MAQVYEYRPLSREQKETRVLKLLPSEIWDATLKGSLQTRTLEMTAQGIASFIAEPFETVSYRWDNFTEISPDSMQKHVLVDGYHIDINDNLESFLRHRREPETVVSLWVDAICINQTDLTEKNGQIPLMGIIYNVSRATTIWLGPASHDSDRAMNMIHKLGSGSPYWKMPLLARDTLTAVKCLLNRSWWTRIWIIQEIVAGGFHIKMHSMNVMCGKSTTDWMHVVLAAARMKCYQDDRRQYFPNIDNILGLDGLRYSPLGLTFTMPDVTRDDFFSPADLLSRCRHYQASDARDKIYAIYKMFSGSRRYVLKPRYEDSIAKVYTEFATKEYRSGDCEILRHCGLRTQGVPSWVPDWSADKGSTPLPSKRNMHYFGIPWWLQPPSDGEIDAEIESRPFSLADRTNYIIPPYELRGYWFEGYAEERKQFGMDMLVKRAQLELNVNGLEADDFTVTTKERPFVDPRTHKSGSEILYRIKPREVEARKLLQTIDLDQSSALVGKGEYIIRTQQERRVLQNITEVPTEPRYSAGRSIYPLNRIDDDCGTLICRGVMWDVIDEVHEEPFPSDIEAVWQNATIFMAAVGASKKRATTHSSAVQQYPTMRKRMRAFWSTLVVGMEQENNSHQMQFDQEFMNWLPELNDSWRAAAPPLTQITSGLLHLSEIDKTILELGREHESFNIGISSSSWTSAFDNIEPEDVGEESPNSTKEFSLIPSDWTHDEMSYYREQFDRLAKLWNDQPYDLYHRPFSLLNVVPDPYWSVRRERDDLAKHKTRKFRGMPMTAAATLPDNVVILGFNFDSYKHSLEEKLKSLISIEPTGTLEIGIEKYALGRRFLITKKDYFGLGPPEIQKGDRIAIIFGQDVPITLRRSFPETGRPAWEVIGEAYVQDIMNGEVMSQWRNGSVEASENLLR